MGQSHSSATAKATQTDDDSDVLSMSVQRKRSLLLVKQKLTRSELLALHHTFQQLKTVSTDHIDFIEPKQFLEKLRLPSVLEPSGILLFKSFSRLGSYPNSHLNSAPIHLSWHSFVTAFAVLTGKLDEQGSAVFETAFFESLAVIQRPCATSVTAVDEQHDVLLESAPVKNDRDEQPQKKGLTLADLGIQFDDIDTDDNLATSPSQDNLKILQRDLIELFKLALWIVHAESIETRQTEPNMESIFQLANTLTSTIKSMDTSNVSNSSSSSRSNISTDVNNQILNDDDDIDDGKDCISHTAFCQWKDRNAPYLYRTIQSFIYTRFAMATPKSTTTGMDDEYVENINDDSASIKTLDLVLSQDIAPLPSDTDILDTNYCALLSWCLPGIYLANKQWRRLYSGDKDGFSMNRFESHVFKYPGPTLFVLKVQTDDNKTMILAGLISESWKHGRQYWGNDQCFLIELYPHFEIFTPTGRNHQYVYCQQQTGMAFGGTIAHSPSGATSATTKSGNIATVADECLLFLDNTLQTGRYHQEQYPALPTFEKSHLRRPFDYHFDILHFEVFGLGDEKLSLLQKKAWNFEYQDANRRSGLQIRQKDGQIDKEILKLAGIIQDEHHHYETNQQ